MMFIALLFVWMLLGIAMMGLTALVLAIVFTIIYKKKQKKVFKILSILGYIFGALGIIPFSVFMWFIIVRPDLNHVPSGYVDAIEVTQEYYDYDNDGYNDYIITNTETNEKYINYGYSGRPIIKEDKKYSLKSEYKANWKNLSTVENDLNLEMIYSRGYIYVPVDKVKEVENYIETSSSIVMMDEYKLEDSELELYSNPEKYCSSEETVLDLRKSDNYCYHTMYQYTPDRVFCKETGCKEILECDGQYYYVFDDVNSYKYYKFDENMSNIAADVILKSEHE